MIVIDNEESTTVDTNSVYVHLFELNKHNNFTFVKTLTGLNEIISTLDIGNFYTNTGCDTEARHALCTKKNSTLQDVIAWYNPFNENWAFKPSKEPSEALCLLKDALAQGIEAPMLAPDETDVEESWRDAYVADFMDKLTSMTVIPEDILGKDYDLSVEAMLDYIESQKTLNPATETEDLTDSWIEEVNDVSNEFIARHGEEFDNLFNVIEFVGGLIAKMDESDSNEIVLDTLRFLLYNLIMTGIMYKFSELSLEE